MSRRAPLIVGDHFEAFIDEQVKKGRFESASEVVRAGLRLLEDDEARLDALRAALIEGEKSGVAEGFDFDGFIERRKAASR